MPAGHDKTYIGVMSGTSMDAVDAVMLSIDANGRARALAGTAVDLPAALRQELLTLNRPGHDELGRAALAGLKLAELYADCVSNLLKSTGVQPSAVEAIGVHGQTVRHRPDLSYTIQLNAPARVAQLTGIDVVSDFRSRDLAAGGQGAPLVPAFHAAQFASPRGRVVLNLGGIANITILDADGGVRGFDTGPANMLMDAWTQRHRQAAYDKDGMWAASGKVIPELLSRLLADPWFATAPPKSTGRDDFNLEWLEKHLAHRAVGSAEARPVDVQATLLQLTASSIAGAIRQYATKTQEVLVCGGGARNTALMSALRAAIPQAVHVTDDYGLPAQWVEGAAFAWLAWCYDARQPAGLPAVTAATRPTVLGCKYLA